ncbi:hypothetical protein ACH4E7_41800 [Kitasatospora sp. NPDC018058]|uniref:hypothetical protein n=1 Tax=Kitasatospora sp. NPDC018058 TaxID=3364025 RepID=UPI0037BE8B7C
MDDFRTALSDELSGLAAPPLGDLVAAATRQGRRVRRKRAVAAAAAVVAVVTALLCGVPGTGRAQLQAVAPDREGSVPSAGARAPGTAASPAPAPAPGTAAPTTTATAAPTGRLVTTTGPALLAVLLKTLPPTEKASHFAADSGEYPKAEADLTDDRGTGRITVSLSPEAGNPCDASAGSVNAPGRCFRDGHGQQVRISYGQVEGPCTQYVMVTVTHPDGTAVHISMPDCLAKKGGTHPPGTIALTEDQAVAIAGDPAFSLRMDSGFVQAAADQFHALPPIDHPDGTAVQISMPDFPTKTGSTHPPGTIPPTEDQAVAIAGDPAHSRHMDPGFVRAAADRSPDLPPIDRS